MSGIDIKEFQKDHTVILASQSARRKEILEKHGISPVIMPMDVDETLPAGIRPHDAVMYLSLKKGLACLDTMISQVATGQKSGGDSPSPGEDDPPGSSNCGSPDISAISDFLIISADTVVAANDITKKTDEHPLGTPSIFGKPASEEDACRMLSSIRGTTHHVMTGVTLIECKGTAGVHSQDAEDPGETRNGYAASAPVISKRVFYDDTKVFVRDITDEDLKAYIDSGEPFGKAGGYAIQLAFGKHIDHIEGDYENVVGLPYPHILKELQKLK